MGESPGLQTGTRHNSANDSDSNGMGETKLKTIGLIGGMSWESTLGYYSALNEGIKRKLGGLHSAKIAIYSVDFAPVAGMQGSGDWTGASTAMCDAARRVEAAGADILLIGANTMHKVAPEVARAVSIPLLHIADATAEVLAEEDIRTVGLLGTAFTMEQDFYRGKLEKDHGLNVLVPDAREREIVHRIIYEELCLGKLESASRAELLRIIEELGSRGAGGVILGCTEIGMLVKQADTAVKLFDTTLIHAAKAVEFATASVAS